MAEQGQKARVKIYWSLLFDPGFFWLGLNFLLVPPAPSVPAVHTQPTHESPHEATLVGAMLQGLVSIRRLACSPISLPLIKASSDNSRGSNYCSLRSLCSFTPICCSSYQSLLYPSCPPQWCELASVMDPFYGQTD